jgi:Carboxypeptidase regulatory-like domain
MIQARLGAVAILLAHSAAAQSGSLVGRISSDSLGGAAIAAEITVPALHAVAHTDSRGRYRVSGLVPGRYLVEARAVGFRISADSVDIPRSGEAVHDFVLTRLVPVLPPVVTTSPEVRYVSPGLRGFEARRHLGFGHFIVEDILRKYDNDRLSDLLSTRIPGVLIQRASQNAAYVSSSRKSEGGVRVFGGGGRLATPCYTTIYLDGALLYDPTLSAQPPPDINQFTVHQLGGVEFYAGSATTPEGFRVSPCGTLLLWTRER